MNALALSVSSLLALPLEGALGYLALLSLSASRPAPVDLGAPPRIRFDVVIPAHDEERGIRATLDALHAVDYPASLRRIVVVADNCSDATARVAAEAGALVLERCDPTRRGKGYALAHAFERVIDDRFADAVVVIDADTTPSPELLRAFAARIEAGAAAVQASYGVRNAEDSWRTRLMVVALALFHDARSLGRARLGLSAGLRGNGMALTRASLQKVPWCAHSIVEDVEHGIALGEAGIRVEYAPEARVLGEMASGGRGSETQRRRWEEGRAALAQAHGRRLVREGVRRRDPVLVDLALDLLIPPLGMLALGAALGLVASAAFALVEGSPAVVIPWLAAAGLLLLYVARGLAVSGAGLRGAAALLHAPAYVAWKIVLRLRRRRGAEQGWVRTAREGE